MAAEDWTEERVKVLTRMWNDGRTCSEIGAVIGMTRNAVIGKRVRIGLPDRGSSTLKHRSAGGKVRIHKPIERRVLTPPHIQALKAMEEKMKAAAPVEAKTQEGALVPLMIPLLDLEPNMCRWPANDPPRGEEFLFCAHEKERGSSWCSFHHRLAFNGRPTTSRGAMPLRRAA